MTKTRAVWDKIVTMFEYIDITQLRIDVQREYKCAKIIKEKIHCVVVNHRHRPYHSGVYHDALDRNVPVLLVDRKGEWPNSEDDCLCRSNNTQ